MVMGKDKEQDLIGCNYAQTKARPRAKCSLRMQLPTTGKIFIGAFNIDKWLS
jgi:hypothetical protein